MTPDQITIYVPPTNCPKCMATKKSFDKAGIAYTVAEMTPEQADEFRERGFTVAPVVHNVHGRYEGWWSGLRTRKIEAAIAHRRNGDG